MAESPITSPLKNSDKEQTANVLQSTLVDLIDLTLAAKQAHWNVVGRNFRSVHLQLDELVTAARGFTDDVAERASTIGVPPNGKTKTVADGSELPEYPEGWQSTERTVELVLDLLDRLIKRVRAGIDETDKSDLVTQDLLIEIASELEKQHWMWQAQQA